MKNAEKEMKLADESQIFDKFLISEEKDDFIRDSVDYLLNDLYKSR